MPIRPVRLLPFLFFVVSGGCALVYEVTWARYLSLFLGNTTQAHMCVLAGFMGGLAVGSLVIGAASGRFRRPLAAYGAIEIGIGAYSIAFPHFIHPVQSMALSAASGMTIGSTASVALKLAVAMGVMVVPTFLMGGTFPLLMEHFRPRSNERGDKGEWLYLANCGGAVVGALLAGFAFIPGLGLRATLTEVGLANVGLGALAASLAFAAAFAPPPKDLRPKPAEPAGKRQIRPVYVAIAVSGAAAMVYELVWIRIFAVVLGSSTYCFTLMVAAFITGIAIGSLIVGLRSGLRARPLVGFAVAEIAIAYAIIASIPLYERLPYVFWHWSSFVGHSAGSIRLHDFAMYSLCFVVMVVPTVFFGMTLPLAIKAAARPGEDIGRQSGFIYGWNTMGTLVGALATGLVLIPALGLRNSLHTGLVINLLAGMLLLWVSDFRFRRPTVVAVYGVAAALLYVMPQWQPMSFSLGTFRNSGSPPPSFKIYSQMLTGSKVLYYGEDASETVAVLSTAGLLGGRVTERSLTVDGKGDASSFSDMPTQVLIGQIPVFLHPDARDVLVVGLGSGTSAGSVLTHPQTRVDCVEISPAVVQASRYFDPANGCPFASPRFHLILEDARTLLAVTPKRYDLVVSQPTNPWVAGIGSLFTVEYYELIDRVLKPDGMMLQWFHTYEISDDLVKMILRSLLRVFPYAYVFQGEKSDYIVVAAKRRIKPDFASMERMFQVPAVKKDLDRISVESVAALLGRQVLSPSTAERLAGTGALNTDDHPLLEYRAPDAQYVGAQALLMIRADERIREGGDLFVIDYLRGRPLDRPTCSALIASYSDFRVRNRLLRYALLSYYVKHWPDDLAARRQLARLRPEEIAKRLPVSDVSKVPAAQALVDKVDAELVRILPKHSAFTPQDFSSVFANLDRAIKLDPHNHGIEAERREIRGVAGP